MKHLMYAFAFILVSINASAQCALIINTTVTPTTSCTANDGMISYSITGGSPPYWLSYNYNGSQYNSTSSPITNLAAGNYFIEILDSVMCYDTLTLFVPNPNQIYLSPVITNVTGSCTNCNGAINLNASGGFGSLTYTWSNGATTSSVSNLCEGNYWVNVYDAAGCSEYRYFNVIDQYTAGISLNAAKQSSACQLCDGWIDISPLGGTAPYSYQWSNGGSANTIANLCSGAYTVTVTDGLGCTKSNFTWLPDSIINLYQYQFNDSITDESCIGAYDGSIQLTYNIPSTNFIYNWSNGSTTSNISNLNSDFYTLYIMDTVTHQCFIVGDSMWGGFVVGINGSGPNCGTISGRIYFDDDTNCVFNGTDYGFGSSSAYAIINPGNHKVYPDVQGYYSSAIAYGVYNVSHDVYSSIVGASCNPVQNVILNSTTPTAVNIDFADSSTAMPDLAIHANCSTAVLGGFQTVFNVWLSNLSFNSATGTVYFVMDSVLSFDSASVTPSYINGDTIFWTNQFSAFPFPSNFIKVYCYVDPSTPVTYVLNLCTGVIPNGADLSLLNNLYCWQCLANGFPFDPNIKTVTPVGSGPNGNVSLNVHEFTYMIQFQNTGTAPAQNVVLIDTLSQLLDWSSLHILHSSHNYLAEVDANGIVQFRFPNINLPDSGSNEPLSHGYIQYAINRIANVQIGNQIKNTADIYFDFNPPVTTNTVINTFVTALGVEEYGKTILAVFPNPAHDEISISLAVVSGDANLGQKTITLCDVAGRTIKTIPFFSASASDVTKLNLKSISKGIYFLKVTDANGLMISSDKVVVN